MTSPARHLPSAILIIIHAAGLALAAINPIAPFAVIGGAAGAILLFSYQHLILVTMSNLGLVKGFLIDHVPIFAVVDFSILLAGLSVSVILWQIAGRQGGRRLSHHSHLIIAYLAWVVWMFIAAGYAPNPSLALVKAGRFALFTSILFISPLALIGDRRDSQLLLRIYIGFGLFAAILMIVRLYGFATALTIDPTSHRLTILGSNPIAVARILVISTSMLLAGMATGRFKGTKWLAAVALMLAAAVLTGSRGPLVSFVGAWLVLALLHRGLSKRIILWGIMSLSITMAIFFYLAPPELTGRFLNYSQGDFGITNQGFATVNTVSSRLNLWKLAVSVWASGLWTFLFGLGTAGYASLSVWNNFAYPHNLPLELLVEYGIIGFALFMWQVTLVGPHLLPGGKVKLSPEAFMWQAAIVTFFLATLFSGDLNDNRLLWFLVAAFMATRAIDLRPEIDLPGR